MAKRRTSTGRKRGGNWFKDLGSKLSNEFTNPKSLMRQQFYRDGALRKALPGIASAVGSVPYLGQAASLAAKASDYANMLGYGRKRKYVKYVKSKSHGKRKAKK